MTVKNRRALWGYLLALAIVFSGVSSASASAEKYPYTAKLKALQNADYTGSWREYAGCASMYVHESGGGHVSAYAKTKAHVVFKWGRISPGLSGFQTNPNPDQGFRLDAVTLDRDVSYERPTLSGTDPDHQCSYAQLHPKPLDQSACGQLNLDPSAPTGYMATIENTMEVIAQFDDSNARFDPYEGHCPDQTAVTYGLAAPLKPVSARTGEPIQVNLAHKIKRHKRIDLHGSIRSKDQQIGTGDLSYPPDADQLQASGSRFWEVDLVLIPRT
jgi:hypothetical protein